MAGCVFIPLTLLLLLPEPQAVVLPRRIALGRLEPSHLAAVGR